MARHDRDDELRAATSGVVYVEFLMAFMPVFLLFLGVAQLVLLFAADLVVHHAAVRATRAAIVIADDDPQHYAEGDRRGVIGGREATADDVLSALARGNVFTRAVGDTGPRQVPSRRSDVEVSAALVLLPLAPAGGDSLADAIATPGLRLAARGTLRRMDLRIAGGDEPFGRDAPITLRLRYRYPCSVPLARRLVCRDDGTSRILESEVTLPNQGASYEYARSWSP
jgi:hypothetical protein